MKIASRKGKFYLAFMAAAGLCSAAAVGIHLKSAQAAGGIVSMDCTGGIDYIDYTESAGLVRLQMGCLVGSTLNSMFVETTAPAGCSSYNRSADSVREMTNLVQTAALSGKPLRLYYENCGGRNNIATVSLRK